MRRTVRRRTPAGWKPLHHARSTRATTSSASGIIGRISGFDIHIETRSGLTALDVTVSLPGVPRSGCTLPKEPFLEARLGLVQRIQNGVSGVPALVDQARTDLQEAEQTVADTQQRLREPFRQAQALPRGGRPRPRRNPARRDAGRTWP